MVKPVIKRKQAIVTLKDVNLLVRILKANWWVPLVILPIFYAIGRLYAYRLTITYKASTEFLIKPNEQFYQNNVLTEQSFYGYGTYVDNLNEIRVLQSYDLAKKVVEKLLDNLQVSYYIVGKVRTTEQFNGMPFKITVNTVNPYYYERTFDIRVTGYDTYEITYEEGGSTKLIKGEFNKELLDINLGIKVTRTGMLSKKTLETFRKMFYQFKIHTVDYLVSNIRSNLSVENPSYTNSLKIVLKDIVPERAVLVLDTLNKVYANGKLEARFELNDRTVEFIDLQLNQITYSLKSIEDTMQNYKQNRSIINLDWQQNDFLSKISTYDGDISKLQLKIRELQDLERYIIEDKDPQFLPPRVFISENDGFLQKAVEDLYSSQIELNRLSGIVKTDNPVMLELKSKINKTKQDLLIYINNTKNATQKQRESLDKEIVNYINEVKQIPGMQRDVLNIQRKANVSEQLYNFLLEKKASTKIARASIVSDVRIVEAPRYAGIDSPDKDKIEKQFLSFGLFMVLLVVFIRSFFFNKIKTVEQLKDMTSIPLIGVLPLIKQAESEGIVVEQSPNSLIAESFRNFRTNLQYANVDIKAKSYLITSYLPGEGKTFTSANLAVVLAKSGKRTVILELDLHKPRVYKRFGLDKQDKGITTYITGSSTYEEILSPTIVPNLFCVYSGPIPPNPSELVLSEKLKEIIDRAKQDFDYVIIDTPPAGLLSDSVYLIQHVDASIFVLNTRSSDKKVINFIESVMQENNINNILLLLNGVPRPGRRYYYQGYGYSYGYGYGYGYGYAKSRNQNR